MRMLPERWCHTNWLGQLRALSRSLDCTERATGELLLLLSIRKVLPTSAALADTRLQTSASPASFVTFYPPL